jgi:FkbM family methyltransferase
MKKIIRRFFNRFGYDIIKTDDRYISKSTREKIVQVGKFQLYMPANNIQLIHYKMYPQLNSQLGRLAMIIEKKYSDMTAIDVGANVGDTVAVIKSAIDIPIIAIEGDEISYKFLEKNIRQFSSVSSVKTFLSDKTYEVKADLKKSGWNTTIIPSEEGQLVSFKMLDQLLNSKKFESSIIKLIKIDVEGFDTIVLRGSTGTIKKHKPVLFFEYNRDRMLDMGEDGLSTLISFKDYGYNKTIFFDHNGRLLISTSIKNITEINCLHEYAVGKNNLLGYYDICMFHQEDDDIGHEFLEIERNYLSMHS